MQAKEATMAGTRDDEMLALADRLATVYATYRGADEVFTPDALFDINVPAWRFQVEGADGFLSWLKGESSDGYGIRILRAAPTASGFAVEIEGEYAPHGHELYFRNLLLCQVRDGRISEVVFYCTGDWDAETRAHQREHAPMIRP